MEAYALSTAPSGLRPELMKEIARELWSFLFEQFFFCQVTLRSPSYRILLL
jgi:hypothetical protein